MPHPNIRRKVERRAGFSDLFRAFLREKPEAKIKKPNLNERTRYAPKPMNSPSPLIPQGSSLEQQQQARSTLKMKIFCALGVNVVVLLVLLMQGCKREQPQTIEQTPMFSDTNPPPMDLSGDTNLPSVSTVDTNARRR